MYDLEKLLIAGSLTVIVASAYLYPRDYVGPSDTVDFSMANVVEYSSGGRVLETDRLLSLAAAAGHHQVINGKCLSSCTLVLTYPHVCWTTNAEFGFHGATEGFVGMIELYSRYPAELGPYVPITLTPREWITITGENMALILGRDLCKKSTPTLNLLVE
jgi:hypothetical protein